MTPRARSPGESALLHPSGPEEGRLSFPYRNRGRGPEEPGERATVATGTGRSQVSVPRWRPEPGGAE